MIAKSFIALFTLSVIACSAQQTMETVVVGGGLMGSAAAWHLSLQGEKVLLLEQQSEIYSNGSSFGDARIARSLGPPDDMWSYLHNRAVTEAVKLVDYLNQYDDQPHNITDLYTTSPVSYVRHNRQRNWLTANTTKQNDTYQVADHPDSAQRLFGINLPDSAFVLREYKEHSGIINPRALISKLHRGIRLKDNRVLYGHRVEEIAWEQGLYHLKVTETFSGTTKTILCKKLVSAAGPYTGKLLHAVAPYFQRLIVPKRVFLGFLKIPDEVFKTLTEVQVQRLITAYPVISSSEGSRAKSSFSMIEDYTELGNPIIKIGGHYQRSPIKNLDSVWRIPLSAKEIAWTVDRTLNYMEILDLPVHHLEFIKGYSCVYSLTQSEVPYITSTRENDPTMVVMGGLSGVGAKGAMSYGLIAANLLLGVTEEDPLYKKAETALGYSRLRIDINNQ